jgi:hypothetical protein
MTGDELPLGWEWLSEWDERTPEDKKKGGPIGDYSRLMKAADARKIRAYKQDGAWVVHSEDARVFIEAAHGRLAAKADGKKVPADELTGLADSIKALRVAMESWADAILELLVEIRDKHN